MEADVLDLCAMVCRSCNHVACSCPVVQSMVAGNVCALLIGAETAGGVMTKLIVRNITVLGALNSDVHAKLPFLLESSLADVLCCLGARILCLACFQHVCMRLPVLGSSFFLHLLAVDSLDVLNLRNSSVCKKKSQH